MKEQIDAPRTLLQAVRYFSNLDTCLAFLAGLRWPNGITCPHCKAERISFLTSRRIWKCLECKKQFSIKTGTIFEDSPLGLDKWLPCLWMIANCKNGISSYEVGRALGVTQKTAWFMLHRIRLAMQTKSFNKIGGEIEIDETYIGGKARFMHKSKKERIMNGKTGMTGKVAVMGLLERNTKDEASQVRLMIVKSTRTGPLDQKVRENVESGSAIYTDALASYRMLNDEYIHSVIDHSEKYVEGKIHTNGMENFWSLLKRSIKGTYVSVEPFHLFRYLDEQSFRFNNRKDNDLGRFLGVVKSIIGRRVMYKELTGKTLPEAL